MLSSLDQVPICVAYEVDGERVDDMPMTVTGFTFTPSDLRDDARLVGGHDSDCRRFEDSPQNAQNYILRLEELSGAHVSHRCRSGPRPDHRPARHSVNA